MCYFFLVDGSLLFSWMKDLFPVNRSLSGEGNRITLKYIKDIVPEMQILTFPSGKRVFDWTIPDEWNVVDAYVQTAEGLKIAQFKENNLHLVGYSEPVDVMVDKSELVKHLHFMPDFPEAIPYVTSYYERNWGFCLTKKQFDSLGAGPFRVFIDSSFKTGKQGGVMNYGELYVRGYSTQEVIFSTYICHPSMANNELSGPVVATALALYLAGIDHHYSYRFLFLPETIGAIAYLSNNLESLKKSVVAGWVLTCLGDGGNFSYIPSRSGNNYADRITRSVMSKNLPQFNEYSWLDRGSDERQYCSPGVDLPICSVTRSKYGSYKQYHTSADDLNFVSESCLWESYLLFQELISEIERNRTPKIRVFCEPQLGRRGLYPNLSRRDAYSESTHDLVNVISYLDGTRNLSEIANLCRLNLAQVEGIVGKLSKEGLIDI